LPLARRDPTRSDMTAPMDQTDLLDRAARLVETAKRAGADAADAVSHRRVSLGIESRLGKVEETTRSERDDFSLRVFVGKRNASVSANSLTPSEELVERAIAMAKAAPEDRYASLADNDRLASDWPDLDLLDETIPTVEELTARAQEAEDAARAVTGVTNSGGINAGWSVEGLVLATSGGFAGSYLRSRHSLTAIAIAGEGQAMERDYDYAIANHLADLADAAEVGRKAGERAVRRLNPGRIDTGPAAVVFDERVASSLAGHLAAAANGASVARKTTFLGGDLGKPVFASGITIADDPLRRRGLASRPFDAEGVVQTALDLVADGVLKTWLLDTATARELGLATNGRAARAGGSTMPATTNLALMPGDLTPEALIREIGDGILVSDLIGAGVNLVTGDYSRGAAGFRIKNGELAEPLTEITIAGNLRDMFARLRPANDLVYRYTTNAPTVAIEGMTVAGR
jgi:PmbA protein